MSTANKDDPEFLDLVREKVDEALRNENKNLSIQIQNLETSKASLVKENQDKTDEISNLKKEKY